MLIFDMPKGGFPLTKKETEILRFYAEIGFNGYMKGLVMSLPYEAILNGYMAFTENQSVNQLIKYFEKFVLDFKDGQIQKRNIYDRLYKLKTMIDQHEYYREFLELSYLLTRRYALKRTENKAIHDIYSILITDLSPYLFKSYAPLYIDRVTNQVKLCNEGLTTLDENDYKLMRKQFNTKFILPLDEIINRDANALMKYKVRLYLSNVLDENDSLLWNRKLAGTTQIPELFPEWKSTVFYKECLEERKRILRPEGVTYSLKQTKWYSEIYLQEKYYSNGEIYLLFALTDHDGNSIEGIYNLKTQGFLSCFTDINEITYGGKSVNYSLVIENFILEIYTFLTCEIKVQIKKLFALQVFQSESEWKQFGDSRRIALVLKNDKTNTIYQKQAANKIFCANTEKVRKKIQIKPYIRKLPDGYMPSTEAIENAKKYGILLLPGITFVSGFEKTIGVNDKGEVL